MWCGGVRSRATASSSTAESAPPDTASTRRCRRDSNPCTDVSTARTSSGMSGSYFQKWRGVSPPDPWSALPAGVISRYLETGIQRGADVGDTWTAGHFVGRPRTRRVLHGADLGEPPSRSHAHAALHSPVDVGAGPDGEAEGEVAPGIGMGHGESGSRRLHLIPFFVSTQPRTDPPRNHAAIPSSHSPFPEIPCFWPC